MIGEGERSCGWAREERATGGVLLFAELAACRQGCLPITGQPRPCLSRRPSRWPARPSSTLHAPRSMLHITARLGGGWWPLASARCGAAALEPAPVSAQSAGLRVDAATDKGEPLRTSWPGSGAGSKRAVSPRATQWAIGFVAGASERAAHHSSLLTHHSPARRASRCSGARGNAHPTGKSQSHLAGNPARVANVIPQPSTRCVSLQPIR